MCWLMYLLSFMSAYRWTNCASYKPGVFFLDLDDLRFEEADEGFEASLEGPAESL